MNPNDTKIPIVQKIFQIFGALLEIFFIKLFNFLVLNIANNGKKRYAASFLFLNRNANRDTSIQKMREIINQGLKKKSKNVI